jgi:protein gp37
MGNTSIEWTDKSWNPIAAYFEGKRGWICSKPSPGCKNCYSEALNLRLGNGLRYTPENVAKVEWRVVNLDEPGKWRKPQRVFVESMGDLFHEALPDEMIGRIWGAMLSYPRHTFQVLTKRADRMRELVTQFLAESERKGLQNASHIWLGVSVENQEQADKRIPELLKIPGRVRFLSCEPLLGPVDLSRYHIGWSRCPECDQAHDPSTEEPLGSDVYCFNCDNPDPLPIDGHHLNWVIAGGESGPKARPMHPDWARSLRDQCQAAGVPFFFKQWGEFVDFNHCEGWNEFSDKQRENQVFLQGQTMIRVGKKAAGRLLDGVEHNQFPQERNIDFAS